MSNEKITFYKKVTVEREESWKKLAVKPSVHEQVSELADKTGLKKNEVANRLIAYALKYVEIKEFDE